MSGIAELFGEYTRMRQHGLDAQEALQTLRGYLHPLSPQEREELARLLRGWESKKIETQTQLVVSVPDTSPLTEPAKRKEDLLECPHCHRNNRAGDVFCYACGRVLESVLRHDTLTFTAPPKDVYNDENFGPKSLLILETKSDAMRFEVRPQQSKGDVVIGRVSPEQKVQPDIDLSLAHGIEQGVSRLHLALRYYGDEQVIQINDLGSANGTFVNGQKLHPSERRILRDGDELRLGKLALRVLYHHPGKEMP